MTINGEKNRKGTGAATIDIVVDSGAAEVVAPPTLAADYITRPSPGSNPERAPSTGRRAGTWLPTWVRRIRMMAEGGGTCVTTFQVVGVTKRLASAARTTSKGHNIVLGAEDA